MQDLVGGRVRKDGTWCPSAVHVDRSSCQSWEGSLLTMSGVYSFDLVLSDFPQCSRRCLGQGRVGECVRERGRRGRVGW